MCTSGFLLVSVMFQNIVRSCLGTTCASSPTHVTSSFVSLCIWANQEAADNELKILQLWYQVWISRSSHEISVAIKWRHTQKHRDTETGRDVCGVGKYCEIAKTSKLVWRKSYTMISINYFFIKLMLYLILVFSLRKTIFILLCYWKCRINRSICLQNVCGTNETFNTKVLHEQ